MTGHATVRVERPLFGAVRAVLTDLDGPCPDCIAREPGRSCAYCGRTGLVSSREVWEALATRGVIPEAWTRDLGRVFADPPEEWTTEPVDRITPGRYRVRVRFASGAVVTEEDLDVTRGYYTCSPREHLRVRRDAIVAAQTLPVPATVNDLVAFVSAGPERVEAVEEFARETVARLRPFGVSTPAERVVWRVATPGLVKPYDLLKDGPTVQLPRGWPARAQPEYAAAVWSDMAFQAGLAVRVFKVTAGLPAAEQDAFAWWTTQMNLWPDEGLPSPHEPVLQLLLHGFGFEEVSPRIVLNVPPV